MEVVLIHKVVVWGDWCVVGRDVMVGIMMELWLKE